MYYRFSKLAKIVIIFSFILTVTAIIFYGYNLYRIIETNRLIFDEMAQNKVLRETAIHYLENKGAELFLGGEFVSLTGIILGILAFFSLYQYSKDNSFFFAMTASFLCLFTSFISGLLLFCVIFSGKSEISVETGERKYDSEWERFISVKSRENPEK